MPIDAVGVDVNAAHRNSTTDFPLAILESDLVIGRTNL